ncbi:MAG: DEAD/DEAH box helicase family protein, partial [Spirochaetales bacterium]|nr:DEAD/DEAH box helicase family protein [Spirochaetales bacterium]
MMNLRSYQNEAVDAVIANWRDGNRRTLLNMATGTGKTICFSSVISRS